MEFHAWGRDYYPGDDWERHEEEYNGVDCAIDAPEPMRSAAHVVDEVFEFFLWWLGFVVDEFYGTKLCVFKGWK